MDGFLFIMFGNTGGKIVNVFHAPGLQRKHIRMNYLKNNRRGIKKRLR